jgi:hypothetical protein
MRTAARLRIVGIALTVLATGAWSRPSLHAQEAAPAPLEPTMALAYGGIGGGAVDEGPEAAPRVFRPAPVTTAAAKTWMKLQQPISIPFENDTPLEDVLKYIRQATASKEDTGIPIYLDPASLAENDRTMQSPVTMSLEGIPLETTLRLLLKQLGLAYEVQKDGLLIISSEANPDGPLDPMARILDELTALRAEVAALRREVSVLRAPAESQAPRGGTPSPAGGGGGGGFR